MDLSLQKRLAADVLNCSKDRVSFKQESLKEIKEAITRAHIKSLIKNGLIEFAQKKGTSKYRARKLRIQKRKGRRKGAGSRKGKSGARLNKKRVWINKIRLQRNFIKSLRSKGLIDKRTYYELYSKSKGGFFRSERHIKLYVSEHGLIKTANDKK